MVWEKIREFENHTRWKYNGDGITRFEDVPKNFVPCNSCQKNWTTTDVAVCLFCKSNDTADLTDKQQKSSRISITL